MPASTIAPHTATPYEIIETDAIQVWCDGGGGALGHPRVFLHLHDETGEILCPYCSRLYVLKRA